MSRLEIALLGPMQVVLDGEPVTRFRANTVRALLAYLAMHAGVTRRREYLAALLWPDELESVALQNLRQTLRQLRTAIGDEAADPPFLDVTRTTLAFASESDHWLDVAAFSEAIAASKGHAHRRLEACAACAAWLREAVALYRGEFLAGFSLPSTLFEEWMVVEREHLHGQVLEALTALAAYHERCGDHDEVIGYARRQVELEPWQEEAHRQWMRALALSGQRTAALAQYEACRRILREELGVEPSAETVTLYERIRDEEDLSGGGRRPPPDTSVHSNLPAQLTSFVGREAELEHIAGYLADPACRLLTLVGPGGMGKTRLALEAVRAALERYPAGVWLVELGAVTGGESVPRAAAVTLGVQEQLGRPLPETIAGALQGRELLLVLDNCEHVIDSAASLAALLLSRCPELTVLATSREPLHVPGEQLYDLPPMALPAAGDPAERLFEADTVQLFAGRAAAVRPGFDLDVGNVGTVADICRRLDGMPLAIELAAARLRALSLADLAQRLEDHFRLLAGGSRAALPRHQTLRGTVAWSYDLLDDAERALFDRLSVFAGSFDLEGVEAVCGADGVRKEEVLERLAGLVDKSLVARVEGPEGTTRYRLLETLRAYGQERLVERGQAEEVAARHAGYYVLLAEAVEPVLHEGERDMLPEIHRLDAEAENLAAAVRWSLAWEQPEAAMRIGGALQLWAERRPHLAQYAEWMRRALAQGEGAPPLYRAKALDLIGDFAWHHGPHDEMVPAAQAELDLARAAGEPRWVAWGVYRVGIAALEAGDRERARARLQESLRLARECGDRRLAMRASTFLAGDEPPARTRALLEGLLLQAPHYDRVWIYYFLVIVAVNLGDLNGALNYFRESLSFSTELGDFTDQGALWVYLSEVYATRGEYAEAERLLARGRELIHRMGNDSALIWADRRLGRLAWRRGELEEASARFQEGLDLARQRHYGLDGALAQLGLALVACERGEYDRAEAMCEKARIGLAEWDRDAEWHITAHCTQGRIALYRSQAARAVASYREGLRGIQPHGYTLRTHIVENVEYLGWALAADGQAVEAARHLALAARARDATHAILPPVDRPHHEAALAAVRAALDEGELAAAWAQGEGMDIDQLGTEPMADP